MARDSGPPPPTRAQLRRQITGLIDGTGTREGATAWALQWVAATHPGVTDRVAWEALNDLAGADSPLTDRPYLYERVDLSHGVTHSVRKAERFGRAISAAGHNYSHVTAGEFPSDLLAQLERPVPTGVESGDAVFVRNPGLPGIRNARVEHELP